MVTDRDCTPAASFDVKERLVEYRPSVGTALAFVVTESRVADPGAKAPDNGAPPRTSHEVLSGWAAQVSGAVPTFSSLRGSLLEDSGGRDSSRKPGCMESFGARTCTCTSNVTAGRS